MSDGGAAFPLPLLVMGQGSNDGLAEAIASALGAKGARGMTLRDYFAGQALAGLVANTESRLQDDVEAAWEVADAMLAARERDDTPE